MKFKYNINNLEPLHKAVFRKMIFKEIFQIIFNYIIEGVSAMKKFKKTDYL